MQRMELDIVTGSIRLIGTAAHMVDGAVVLIDEGQVVPPGAQAPVPAQAPAPRSVTRFQARAALLAAGQLGVAAAWFERADVDPLALLAWHEAGTWERRSLLLMSVALALGWADAEVDDLFREAASIEV